MNHRFYGKTTDFEMKETEGKSPLLLLMQITLNTLLKLSKPQFPHLFKDNGISF